MINISIVCVNFSYGPKYLNSYQIPYSAGCLWTYVEQFDNIKNNYKLNHVLWRRDLIDNDVEKLKDQDIVCFSSYIWNRNYSYKLAERLKQANPKITIVFGGPEPPVTDINFFMSFPYIDYVVVKEGEEIFRNLLESFVFNTDQREIKGLLVNHNGNTINTGEAERLNSLDNLPSPYLTGFFDKMIADNPDVKWSAIFETNRGCPYQCTFCDWGSLTYSKFRKFELQRCLDEIEWFGKNKMDFVYIADSNFGVFYERDIEIARKLSEVMNKYGHPSDFNLTWAKNQTAKIMDIVKVFTDNGYQKGLTISTQSMNTEVLEAIKRKNMGINKISELYEMCEKSGIPLNTELILGLPKETLETWKQNFYKLYEAGNHRGISIYPALLLENAEMNLVQRAECDLKTVIFPIEANDTDVEVPEGTDTVIETSDMPLDKMKEAIIYTNYQNLTHIGGITNWVSRFLVKYLDITYDDFYEGLWLYLEKDSWVKDKIEHIKNNVQTVVDRGNAFEPFDIVGPHHVGGLSMYYTLRFWATYERKEFHIFEIMKKFVKDTYDLDNALFQELMDFQSNMIVGFEGQQRYPFDKPYQYNIYGYIISDEDLHEPKLLTFYNRNPYAGELLHFMQKIQLNRRAYFGSADVKSVVSINILADKEHQDSHN